MDVFLNIELLRYCAAVTPIFVPSRLNISEFYPSRGCLTSYPARCIISLLSCARLLSIWPVAELEIASKAPESAYRCLVRDHSQYASTPSLPRCVQIREDFDFKELRGSCCVMFGNRKLCKLRREKQSAKNNPERLLP